MFFCLNMEATDSKAPSEDVLLLKQEALNSKAPSEDVLLLEHGGSRFQSSFRRWSSA
jgi:hypothetical protein